MLAYSWAYYPVNSGYQHNALFFINLYKFIKSSVVDQDQDDNDNVNVKDTEFSFSFKIYPKPIVIQCDYS